MQLTHRTYIIALASIFLFALGLRIGLTSKFVGLDSPPDMSANPDQFDYEWGAYQITQGNGLVRLDGTPTATRTPGTALSLAPAYAVFGRSFAAGRIWFCILSAATCLAVAWVAWQLAGRGASLLAAALLAIYPGHAYYAMHFVSEVPYALYITLAVALSIQAWRTGGRWSMVGAGGAWAMAIHCRPQLLLLAPIVLVALLAMVRKMDRALWMAAMRQWAVQTCVIAAFVAPWFARNAIVMGKPVFTTIAGHGLWGSHNPLTFDDPSRRGDWIRVSELEQHFGKLPQGEVAKDAEASRRGRQSIAANIPRLPQIVLYKMGRFLSPFMETPNTLVRWAFALSWMAVFPLILLGGWQAWKHTREGMFIFMLPVLATIATVVLFYGSIRFRDSIAPLSITLAGIGAARIVAMFNKAQQPAESDESQTGETIPMPTMDHRRAA